MTDPLSLADGPLFGLPLADVWFVLLFALLAAFLVLDGFDFGIGVLFAARDDHHEREQLLAVVGPFWDGNEVWLVVFGGALFAAFPPVYANLFSRYYLLMFAILGALGLRGLAPEMYEEREDPGWRRVWGASFVVGSALAPFLVGVFALNWLVGAAGLVSLPGVLGGAALVALTVVDGAAFLGMKTRGSLREAASGYGVPAAVAYLVAAVLTLAAVYATTPVLRDALLSAPALGLVGATVALVVGYVAAMRRGRFHLAFGAAAAMVFGLVALVATLMFPVLDRTAGLTVEEAVVSTLPLNLMTVMMAFLLPLVLGYFAVLYSAFSGPIEAGEGY